MGKRWGLHMPGLPLEKANNATTPTRHLERKKTLLEAAEMHLSSLLLAVCTALPCSLKEAWELRCLADRKPPLPGARQTHCLDSIADSTQSSQWIFLFCF